MAATSIEQLKREAMAGMDRLDATLANMPPLVPKRTLADAQRAKREAIAAAMDARAATPKAIDKAACAAVKGKTI